MLCQKHATPFTGTEGLLTVLIRLLDFLKLIPVNDPVHKPCTLKEIYMYRVSLTFLQLVLLSMA